MIIDLTRHEHLIRAHVKTLRCFCRGAMCEDDLMQAGRMAIMYAWGRFDPDRGVKFSTYATYWVRHRLWMHVMSMGYPVRYPNKAFKQLKKTVDMVPFGVSLDADHGTGNDVWTLRELIPDQERMTQDECLRLATLARMQDGIIRELLDEREYDIVTKHFGEGETLSAAGARHGVSRERARQLFERGMGKLRQSARIEDLREFLEGS